MPRSPASAPATKCDVKNECLKWANMTSPSQCQFSWGMPGVGDDGYVIAAGAIVTKVILILNIGRCRPWLSDQGVVYEWQRPDT